MKFKIYINLLAGGLLFSNLGAAEAQTLQRTVNSSDSLTVIPVAYGRATKQNVTYSVSTIQGSDIINNSVYAAGNTLYGKLPGLAVLQRTSEPGNDAPTLYLRGRSTTATNTPLIMVDGIERDLNDVPVEDIASISVLKDAAATVLYGIRGANGAILVTTRRGVTGDLKINAKLEQGFQTPTRVPTFVNSAQFVKLYNQALINDGLAPQYTDEQIAGYESGDRYYYPNVNWQDEVAKEYAPGSKANINVSGGDKIGTYFVSLGYFHQGGIYKNTQMNEGYSTNEFLDNVSFRSNLDLNASKNWSFGLDLSGRIYQRNSPSVSSSTIWDMIYKYPSHLFPVYVQDGVYGGTSVYPNNIVGYINSQGYHRQNNRLINSTLSTKYDFGDWVKGLSAGTRFSTDNYYANAEGHEKSFLVRELLGQDASGQPVLSPAIGTNGQLQPLASNGNPINDEQNRRNTFEANLQYSPQLGNSNSFNALVMYHQDRQITGAASPFNYQFISGRVNYGYHNRYFAEVGASYSGTEAFPKGHRFGFFPAASVAWVLSEENFLKDNPVVNLLKLRLSAGAVGNSSVGERFSDLRQYVNSGTYYFGSANAGQGGIYEGVTPNKNFTWETSYKYDAGLDTRLFNSLDASLTYFFEKRKDILVSWSTILPAIYGSNLPNINAGTIHNHGFEGSLFYTKQQVNWGYRAGLNASYVTDKIKYFPEAPQPYDYLYKTGNRVNQPYMLEAIGFFNSVDEINSSPEQTFGPVKPGDIKYKDQNGDGRIDEFDIVPLKNSALPTWDLGLDLGFNYKGFDISAFFQGQLGRSIYLGNEPYLFWPLYNDSARISAYPDEFWTEETKNTATYPRLTTIENKNNYRASSLWYVNGNFLRMRMLDIGYSLPKHAIRRAGLSSARIFVRAMNLFTLDHLDYADPEVQSGYPVMKSYNAGISLQF